MHSDPDNCWISAMCMGLRDYILDSCCFNYYYFKYGWSGHRIRLSTSTVQLVTALILRMCRPGDKTNWCAKIAATEFAVTIFTLYCAHVDDLYLSMICLEHAHYLVAMQDHVQINIYNIIIYKYTPLPVSRVIRGSPRISKINVSSQCFLSCR